MRVAKVLRGLINVSKAREKVTQAFEYSQLVKLIQILRGSSVHVVQGRTT